MFISRIFLYQSGDIKHLITDNTGLILTAAQHSHDTAIKITQTFP